MMKKILLLMICCFPFTLSAQEALMTEQDMQKIRTHLQRNYQIPPEIYYDSITRIDYKIQFTIDEEGRVIEPKIIYKSTECISCEREIFRVLKRTPAVTPAIIDDKKVKSIYQLPFNIMLQ